MGIDNFVRIMKNVLRWFGVLFFAAGASVCMTTYKAPIVAVLWFWTAIIVSPLPTRLRDSSELNISNRVINTVTWIMVGVAFGAVFTVMRT